MGILISGVVLGLLALVEWSLEIARVLAGVLCLGAAPLFLLRRRSKVAGVTAYALGGIGVLGLSVSSGVLWAGREFGVFGVF
ncbi:hypothetical protein E2C00_33755 [Streptomyces sp. WAC05374]|uniref:hypothetical protein n=1 Tax=Streptomyces sp. WAC05374 TaxID=2487420 RepID=UPI000F88C245|nr:hypothetical protein [Streptomyces sp. WAC05374]RST14854.1 hypothetical protein EF905_16500 [Streptomyces sp. WAC05374]TDF37735.1 hypothetical protein E2B92_29535 [Streptomyces sp. WAC05374]TDF45644.1 hypothetical protein E2C02_33250 [Streptomyces sp. WAC05374]TDF46507.1 hypothetical protein E2C00_33755 [Streptomyces sp. WAC05374]